MREFCHKYKEYAGRRALRKIRKELPFY